MSSAETITSTQTVFEGRTVTLKVHDVRLDNGRESKREIVEHRGAVAMVPLTEDGNVLMIEQFRLATGRIMLELPAGTLDHGESPLSAAERELEEEVGMRAGAMQELGAFFVSPGWCTEKITVYLATDLVASTQNLDEDEVVAVVALPLEEALSRATNGQIQDAKSITGLLLADRYLKSQGRS
jgi:ADP-ribose pyrophosphatase